MLLNICQTAALHTAGLHSLHCHKYAFFSRLSSNGYLNEENVLREHVADKIT